MILWRTERRRWLSLNSSDYDLVRQAGGEVVGIGAVIEKGFQGGSRKLREKGYRVESLAVIEKITDGVITFA